MSITIRASRLDDIPRCDKLVEEFCHEMLTTFGFAHDKEHYLRIAAGLIGPTTFIAEEDGEIVGVLAGQVSDTLISGELVYQEVLWFVSTGHRRCGVLLFNAAKKYCKNFLIDKMIFASVESNAGKKVESFYLRKKFRLLEKHFIVEVDVCL